MPEILTLDEFVLRDKARCALSESKLSTGDWNVMPVLAEILRATANGKWPSRPKAAQRVYELNREYCEAHPTVYGTFRVLRNGATEQACSIGVRLAALAQEFWLVQPLEPYTLEIGATRITGQYAVFRTRRRQERCVLYLRGFETEHQPVKPLKRFWPDLVSYARLVHFANTHPGQKVSVLNWHFSRNLNWRDHIDVGFARQCLENAARAVANGLVFPSPGYHCRSCTQVKCCNVCARPPRETEKKKPGKMPVDKLARLLGLRPAIDSLSLPPAKGLAL